MVGARRSRAVTCERGRRIFVMATALSLACSSSLTWAQIRWQSGTSALSGKTRSQIVDTVVSATAPGADRHLVVQFTEPVAPATRAELKAAGLELLRYLGDNAFFASVAPSGVDGAGLGAVTSMIDARAIQRDWRLHPDLVNDIVHEWAAVP